MVDKLKISVPWSLSNYIPLNGFHPLYRAIFEAIPDDIMCSTLNNVKLAEYFESKHNRNTFEKKYSEYSERNKYIGNIEGSNDFYFKNNHAGNLTLNSLIDCDVEFLHTAPTPTFQKPFIFHCESFLPIFIPIHEQGRGALSLDETYYKFYRKMFESDQCLSIMSHLPETLEQFKICFDSEIINKKLISTEIGISNNAYPVYDICYLLKKKNKGQFLFINSAHQNPDNFYRRGGVEVLKFWERYIKSGGEGRLIMRCNKPSRKSLEIQGVNTEFIFENSSNNIIWINYHLNINELNKLFISSEYCLIPSLSLHSVTIMQALRFAAIPIVSDTVGTDLYVKDGINGFVVGSIRDRLWKVDPKTKLMFDDYDKQDEILSGLDLEILTKIQTIQKNKFLLSDIQKKCYISGVEKHCGAAFAHNIWHHITSQTRFIKLSGFKQSILSQSILDLSKNLSLFESPTQPCLKLNLGKFRIYEVGGCLIRKSYDDQYLIHEWSPIESLNKSFDIKRDLIAFNGNFIEKPKHKNEDFDMVVMSWLEELKEKIKVLFYNNKKLYRMFKIFYHIIRSMLIYILRVKHSFLNNLGYGVAKNEHLKFRSEIDDIRSELFIVSCDNQLFVVPQKSGFFSKERFDKKEYAFQLCFNSLNNLEYEIDLMIKSEPELNVENCNGFNIIKKDKCYFAIRQADGAFNLIKFINGEYRYTSFSLNLDEVIAEINMLASIIEKGSD